MGYSLPGFIGAFVGVVVGLIGYAVFMAKFGAALRKAEAGRMPAEREEIERRLSVTRRVFLGGHILTFSVVGYVVGRMVGG